MVQAIPRFVASFRLLSSYCSARAASLRTTPGIGLGISDRVWTIGDLLDAALATQPITPVTTAPDRRKRFRVIDGGRD